MPSLLLWPLLFFVMPLENPTKKKVNQFHQRHGSSHASQIRKDAPKNDEHVKIPTQLLINSVKKTATLFDFYITDNAWRSLAGSPCGIP